MVQKALPSNKRKLPAVSFANPIATNDLLPLQGQDLLPLGQAGDSMAAPRIRILVDCGYRLDHHIKQRQVLLDILFAGMYKYQAATGTANATRLNVDITLLSCNDDRALDFPMENLTH